MAINYKVSICKNPNGIEGTDYYSCKASKTSDYSFEDLANDIAHSTTCTKTDMQDKDFLPSEKIKGYAVHFRPEPALKRELALGIQFKRISSEAMA